MALSKKHFEFIATTIREHQPVVGGLDSETPETLAFKAARRSTLVDVAHRLADMCQMENTNFDRARFLKACGF